MKILTNIGRIHPFLVLFACSACNAPDIYGEGKPTLYPDQDTYAEGEGANVTCSGTLYGAPNLGVCTAQEDFTYDPEKPTCEESNCSLAVSPDRGTVIPDDSNSLYSVITYSCDVGLYLDGSSMAVCTGSGSWQPEDVPVCSENCILPEINQGQATSTDSTLHEGVQIEITCDDGYTLTGPDLVTCHNEEWNPLVGECLANCPSPDIANSNQTADAPVTDHGEYIIVACNDNYTSGTGLDVYEPMTCFNGSWDATVECFANCPDEPAPANGHIYPSTGPYYHSNSVNFNCSNGYTLDGESTSTCNNGAWINSFPTCKADCDVPAITNSNQTSADFTIHHGESVYVVCNYGYSFGYGSEFDGVLTCNDSVLDESNITCYESCPSPNVANSNWENRDELTEFGGTVVVDCDDNYTSGSGSDVNVTMSCVDGGDWDQTVLCYENCPNLNPPDDVIAYPDPPPFFHNNSVFLNCTDDTYVQDGASQITCINGSWSDDVPDCKAPCKAPVIPNSNYGTAREEETTHDYSIVIVCADGYTSGTGAEVNETLDCDDGSWDRNVSCFENCDDPDDPANGSAEFIPPNYHGDKVTFGCDTDYTLDGDHYHTCQDGSWSGETPECKADCGDPGTPTNGTQVYADYRHGGNVTFSCNSGFDILGSATIYCTDGEWSAPIPTCEEETLVDQISLVCDYDSFTVEIPTALLPALNASEIVLENDRNCTGIWAGNGTIVSVTSRLDECGTVLTEEAISNGEKTEYYDVYTNKVVSAPTSVVTRNVEVDLPMKCTYNREQELEVSYKLTDYTISRNLTEDGAYRFLFAIYDSEFQNVISATPYYVGLNEEIHLGLSLLSTGAGLRVTAENCWATPTASPDGSTRWDLIHDRCGKDDTLTIKEDESRSLFSVNSFRFLEHDGMIYIHCDVLVCERGDETCSFPDESCSRRRRRRSAPFPRHKRMKRLRAGPIRWMNTAYQQPNLKQKGMSRSPNTSSFFYKIAISTLGGTCVVLMGILAFVTARLLRRDKQILPRNKP
ncbi:complement factor H-like [Diadema antillarum]|uniref:complement factor H-like n=1 Tax=Diadema antillarum TaxID=105358 RepID=UPI003A88DF93